MFKVLVLASLITGACNNQESTTAETKKDSSTVTETPVAPVFDKLLGTWQNTGDQSYERWTRNQDGSYSTVVFKVNGKDTTFMESNSVYRENGKWTSENKASGQNDGKSVKFVEAAMTANTIHFSNPAHDFPTDIHYTIVDATTVNAYIVGPNNKGGKDTIPFNYTRVQ